MKDLTARYPIDAVEATGLLERWADLGTVVRLGETGDTETERWVERDNLAEMRRVTVAVRRQESLAVAPEVFAAFLLRFQGVDPDTRGADQAFLEGVLEQLQGFSAPAVIWENEILPRRVKGYRSQWLDELLSQGRWLWRATAAGRDDPHVAFFPRDFDFEGRGVETGRRPNCQMTPR